ncbi:porin [Actinoplanes sp. NBRC 14428]|uniref:Amino acid/polyamine/organocation transporter (APC superfamily) n=1 Tax=Pseudosporangium ferrugineum TaxID=439699 RepID=A0A2T0RQE9_9ACTN|nr:APC family permease [Pseudosporangium ferrugineum]PRY23330.1 amino acid/polyamine/organocation transporter (APC superfamily) [Pseudosporangium ferrugineum]BCJ55316.1 porin [Actinoplanes sp. NBRC 14428]
MTTHALDRSAGVERFGYRQELQRSLSFRDLVTYGLIFMVPIAPFGIFGSVFQAASGMVALAYLLGMAAMMVTASSYGVMVRAYPTAGSVYSYAGRAIAPWFGFLSGWTILLDYTLIPGLLSLVAAVSMTAVVPSVPVWVWIVVFVVVNAGINLTGIRSTRRTNTIALVGALAVLGLFIVAAVMALASGAGRGFSWEPLFSGTQFRAGTILTAMSVCMLSFLGFDAMSTLAEDVKGGPRQVSRGMIAALGIIGVLFVVQSFLAALLVPAPDALIADGDPGGTAFYDAARVAAGPWLATVTALATALAWGLSNNMVAQVATSRLLYAMARDRQLPGFLAKVSVSRSVPVNGILLTAAVSLVLGLSMAVRADGITVLASLVNFGALLSFIVVHLSVLARGLRKDRPRVAGWFRCWALPVAGVVILVAVIVNANALAQTVGFVWLGVGVLVLAWLAATGRAPRLSGIGGAGADADHLAGHRG